MSRYDVIIIGTGPGGISAAITATVRNKSVLLLGSSKTSDKVLKAHEIQNYPGLPSVTGKDLAEALLSHAEDMGISIVEDRVTNVYAMGDYYSIQTTQNMYEATSIILATGMAQTKMLPGEEEYLGRGVSYCATCDAALYRGKSVAVLGYNEESVAEANYLAEIVEKVYYIPVANSKSQLQEKLQTKIHGELKEEIEVIEKTPTAISGQMKAEAIEFEDDKLEVDGIFILRDSVAPKHLVPGLSMKDGHVEVDLDMKTNLAGCFACGDVVGKPYQYIKAAGQGNVAALSAVNYIDEKKKGEE